MKEKPRVISFSGKGGSGKTTTASLFISTVIRRGLFDQILVVDADPDANLSTTLGAGSDRSIAQVMDTKKRSMDENKMGERLRGELWNIITHHEHFDFLKIGRKNGEGCYCSINTVLNTLMEETMNLYDLIVIDFDAGLEHFSRRAGRPDDTLVVTCDPSALSFETAGRIQSIVEELNLPYQHRYLVGCRYAEEDRSYFDEMAAKIGFESLGLIPYDSEIARANLKGVPLLGLGADNASLALVDEMVTRVLSMQPA